MLLQASAPICLMPNSYHQACGHAQLLSWNTESCTSEFVSERASLGLVHDLLLDAWPST